MGDELSSDSSAPEGGGVKPAPISYTEQFYKVLPYYLSIGMTWDDFWNGDCVMPKYYREADQMKRERENALAWVQGGYIYDALCAVSPVMNAFAKKGTKPVPYVKEPYPLGKEEATRREREKEVERVNKAKDRMVEWMNSVNKKQKEVTDNGK